MDRQSHGASKTSARVRAALSAVLGGALAAGFLAACDVNKALSVDSPSRIPAAPLEAPANAGLLVTGAISDFECAFGAWVVVGGLEGEELEEFTQTASRFNYDRRDVQSNQTTYATNACDGLGVYTPLQTARVSANNVGRLLQGWTQDQITPGTNRDSLIATAKLYEGWSTLFLGEAFCTTVLSTIDGNTFNFGGEVKRDSAFKAAEQLFTDAITSAQLVPKATNVLNAALMGRARARQDQGNLTGARADAVLVPAAFVFNATASGVSSRRNNRVNVESNTSTMSSSVGARYRTLNDPRVPVQNLNRTNPLGVAAWAQLKYTSSASSIPVTSGDEAQLIVAEADVSSNSANSIAIINAFRAKGNQGVYTGATDAASLKNEIIDQRRRSLFLTGTHFGDLVRYNLVPQPAPGSPSPLGSGSVYGSQTCGPSDARMGLPLPDVERQNNPRLGGTK